MLIEGVLTQVATAKQSALTTTSTAIVEITEAPSLPPPATSKPSASPAPKPPLDPTPSATIVPSAAISIKATSEVSCEPEPTTETDAMTGEAVSSPVTAVQSAVTKPGKGKKFTARVAPAATKVIQICICRLYTSRHIDPRKNNCGDVTAIYVINSSKQHGRFKHLKF